MTINNSNVSMLDSIIRINDKIYLPISDMTIIYNIKIEYIKETNRVVIDELDTGMIRAIAVEDTDIKFKPRGLSKNIGKLKQGETVNCFYTTSKGWRQIRTSNGVIGYIKANKLGDEYIVRQDMAERGEAIKIQKSDYDKKSFNISDSIGTKNIIVKDTFGPNEDKENRVWVSISNNEIANQINELIKDYKFRTELINLIVNKAVENNTNGICIEFTDTNDKENIKRFIIEMTPKLREIGVTTTIVINQNIDKQDYINVVDYIVE